MAGINGIVSEILQDAEKKAEAILAEANKKADAVKEEAKARADAYAASAATAAQKKAEDVKHRAASQAALEKRQAILAAKQDIIDGVINEAYNKLASTDDASYFEMIGRLLKKAVHAGEGEIRFSENDLKRLPAGFAAEAAAAAEAVGGKLTLSDVPVAIENGFVLVYGGIEENCSLKALFASMRDQLQDKVNAAIW
ncbi:MAG: V-type ATP synthase subunit E family protein [Lachnospiraceae bacterium]|nr:V-type ATP synthase subunit E family protein [Lachnospiraceae bacterium]